MKRVSAGQFRATIENFFEDRAIDIACRKRRRGYALYFADDNSPLARLCPTGEDDIVEIDWWDGNHWEPVTEFGLALPLTEALEYIMEDPDNVFFGDEQSDDEQRDETICEVDAVQSQLVSAVARGAFRLTLPRTVTISLLGGACGGMASGALWGLLYGTGAALAFCVLRSLVKLSFRELSFYLVFSGLLSIVLAGAGGAVGASVCQALGHGTGPSLAGTVVALACVAFSTFGKWPAWLVGFVAGLNLGIALSASLDIRQQFLGALTIAGLAAATAFLCRAVGEIVCTAILDARNNNVAEISITELR
jgi:hypothetical protein